MHFLNIYVRAVLNTEVYQSNDVVVSHLFLGSHDWRAHHCTHTCHKPPCSWSQSSKRTTLQHLHHKVEHNTKLKPVTKMTITLLDYFPVNSISLSASTLLLWNTVQTTRVWGLRLADPELHVKSNREHSWHLDITASHNWGNENWVGLWTRL